MIHEKIPYSESPSKGVPLTWFRFRVSIQHFLGFTVSMFHWYPFEGAGVHILLAIIQNGPSRKVK